MSDESGGNGRVGSDGAANAEPVATHHSSPITHYPVITRHSVELSVVIPAYNEAGIIGDTLARVTAYLEARGASELIVVDDGSRDATAAIVEAFAAHHPCVRLVRNPGNRGKGYAIRNGVRHARGAHVLFTDADLVYPIEGVAPFLAALRAGADVAIGSRSHAGTLFALHPRHFSYIYQRYLVGRAYIGVVNALLRLGVADTQCGFKVFRGSVARDIFARLQLDDFAFDVEALYVARQRGYRIVELPLYFLYLGEQSSVELVRDSVRMLRDLWRIRRNGQAGRYARPRRGSVQARPEVVGAVASPASRPSPCPPPLAEADGPTLTPPILGG